MQGGGNCKCINGSGISGGSNGNGVNGGKITAEFNIYYVEGDQKEYVKLEDAQMLFDNLIGIDMEKHRIVGVSDFRSDPEYDAKNIIDYSCSSVYASSIEGNQLTQTIFMWLTAIDDSSTYIRLKGIQNIVSADYDNNDVLGADVVSTIPGTIEDTVLHSLTIYYTER